MSHEDDVITALTVFAAMPVSDLDSSINWYTSLIRRRPDSRPMDGLADYFLASERDPDHETLQLVVDPERADGGLVTINASNAHGVASTLTENGIDLNVDDTTSDRVVFGTILYPDGNAVTIVERAFDDRPGSPQGIPGWDAYPPA